MRRKLVCFAVVVGLGVTLAGGCAHHKQKRRASHPHPASQPSAGAPERADTPLVAAARGGDVERVRQSLDSGSDINARGAQEMTPLMAAAAAGKEDVARL